MSKKCTRGRPPGSSQYRQQDDEALLRMHKLVLAGMPCTVAARKVADDMTLPGSAPVERVRKKYTRLRAEIAARFASLSKVQEPQPQVFAAPLSERIRTLGEAAQFTMSPWDKAQIAFWRSPEGKARIAFWTGPEGQAQRAAAIESYNRIREAMRSVHPTLRLEALASDCPPRL